MILDEGEIFLSDLLEDVKDRFDEVDDLDFGVVTDNDVDFVDIEDPFVYIFDKDSLTYFVIEQYKDVDVAEEIILEE